MAGRAEESKWEICFCFIDAFCIKKEGLVDIGNKQEAYA